jgi:hypothetical protein
VEVEFVVVPVRVVVVLVVVLVDVVCDVVDVLVVVSVRDVVVVVFVVDVLDVLVVVSVIVALPIAAHKMDSPKGALKDVITSSTLLPSKFERCIFPVQMSDQYTLSSPHVSTARPTGAVRPSRSLVAIAFKFLTMRPLAISKEKTLEFATTNPLAKFLSNARPFGWAKPLNRTICGPNGWLPIRTPLTVPSHTSVQMMESASPLRVMASGHRDVATRSEEALCICLSNLYTPGDAPQMVMNISFCAVNNALLTASAPGGCNIPVS